MRDEPFVMQVDGDLVDKIVATEARRMIAMFRQDLREDRRIFHNSAQADRAEIKRHIKAFELVRRYYTPGNV